MEPIRLFLDTNIVLDYFTGRMHDDKALNIMKAGQMRCYELNISFLTAANTMFVARKCCPGLNPSVLSDLFNIRPQTAGQWKTARTFAMPDFEDALQIACAIDAGCDVFISRDRHFENAPIKTYSPEEFLNLVLR